MLRSMRWDQFLEVAGHWDKQPGGELRADLRQSVAIWATLAPYSKSAGRRAPNLLYPYHHDVMSDEFLHNTQAFYEKLYGGKHQGSSGSTAEAERPAEASEAASDHA